MAYVYVEGTQESPITLKLFVQELLIVKLLKVSPCRNCFAIYRQDIFQDDNSSNTNLAI